MQINTRVMAAFASLLIGVLFIVACTILLGDSTAHEVLFGGEGPPPAAGTSAKRGNFLLLPFPYTIHNLMWLMFFLGCGESGCGSARRGGSRHRSEIGCCPRIPR